jgi:DNA-binding NarL/FixJ family response regulator
MLGAGESFVKRVRVLVANHPRLMRELVMATIADQPDIEVVGEVQNETDLADIVEQVLPDVLIIAMDEASADSRSGKVYSGFRKWSFAEPVRIPRLSSSGVSAQSADR